MRGFAKAAALLSSSLASAWVIPTSVSPGIRLTDPTVEYRQSEALLTFQLSSPVGPSEWPILTFQVNPAENFCGEDVVSLNGQPLASSWGQTHAEGSGDLCFDKSSPVIYASWQITCLSGGIDTSNVDGVQVISLLIKNQDRAPGFTISYQAFPTPRILQFDPHPTDEDSILENGLFWRTPSKLTRDVSMTISKNVSKKSSHQKSLSFHSLGNLIGDKLEAMKNAANKAMESCRHHFPTIHSMFNKVSHNISTFLCPRRNWSSHALQKFLTGGSRTLPDATPVPSHELSEAPLQPDRGSSTHDESSSTTDVIALDSHPTPGLTNKLQVPSSFLDESDQRYHQVKTLGLTVILVAILVWFYRWLRDPRRRADRAARREERRRRCLYRRAARVQKLRNLFGAIRRQFCPLTHTVRNWDEKQALVFQQEEVLETVMKAEIRALRQAYRDGSSVVAAEEGRNNYVYDVDNRSERRRSMTTLPGYESEGTQPPGYESDAVSVSGTSFLYTPVDSEDTPDSSVISTSPRISRDGRDSDFGKEVLTDWTLESGPVDV